MSHYDWMYETFTTKKTEEEINSITKRVSTFQKKKEEIVLDLTVVSSEYTKEVLTKEIRDLETRIEKCKKELNGWNAVKKRIENGEDVTYSEAHSIAKRGF